MGLDMYLTTNSRPLAKAVYDKAISKLAEIDDTDYRDALADYHEFKYHTSHVAYWRKANQIHRWFVENVQGDEDNFGLYEVDLEELLELLDTVRTVLNDHSMAEELLPTQSGFFFGSTEYDDYYFMDLEDTKEQLELIFEQLDIKVSKYDYKYAVHPDEPDWRVKFFYQASW